MAGKFPHCARVGPHHRGHAVQAQLHREFPLSPRTVRRGESVVASWIDVHSPRCDGASPGVALVLNEDGPSERSLSRSNRT